MKQTIRLLVTVLVVIVLSPSLSKADYFSQTIGDDDNFSCAPEPPPPECSMAQSPEEQTATNGAQYTDLNTNSYQRTFVFDFNVPITSISQTTLETNVYDVEDADDSNVDIQLNIEGYDVPGAFDDVRISGTSAIVNFDLLNLLGLEALEVICSDEIVVIDFLNAGSYQELYAIDWVLLTFEGMIPDIDLDGITDNSDNCPDIPNGPELGTCVHTSSGAIGTTCMNDGECSTGEVCNNNQEDRDNDGSGDACDNDMICRGLADYDNDVDGTDASMFKSHFGRSVFKNPCPPNGPAPVAKTGQTACYDEDSIPRDCAGTGEDGEHQRGVVWPIPRFTDHEDGTATDNLTGLMWLKDTNCMVTHYPEFDNDSTPGFGDVTWQLALNFISGINTGNYPNCGAGYNDWRLPNPKELLSLIDFKNFDPALPTGHPFNNLWFGFYWSSSSYAVYSREAWAVLLYTGRLTSPDKFMETCYVWPVRGGQ